MSGDRLCSSSLVFHYGKKTTVHIPMLQESRQGHHTELKLRMAEESSTYGALKVKTGKHVRYLDKSEGGNPPIILNICLPTLCYQKDVNISWS